MNSRARELRQLAQYSLGALIAKKSSVESGVREVLRIATAKGHAVWQAWAMLQLTDMFEDDGLGYAREAISNAFPEAVRQDTVLHKALEQYNATRLAPDDTTYRADIGDIEHDLIIFQAHLRQKITTTRYAQRDRLRRIVNKVKNQAQDYLITIENASRDDEAAEEDRL